MHSRNAPAVEYPVGRSRLEAAALLALAAIGAAAAVAWAWQLSAGRAGWPWDRRPLLMLAWLAGGVALAAWAWWRTPGSRLAWDGAAAWGWSGAPAGAVQQVQVAADLQFTLLLRLVDTRGRTLAWLWAERASAPLLWKPLRRALVSGAGVALGDPVARAGQAAGAGERA